MELETPESAAQTSTSSRAATVTPVAEAKVAAVLIALREQQRQPGNSCPVTAAAVDELMRECWGACGPQPGRERFLSFMKAHAGVSTELAGAMLDGTGLCGEEGVDLVALKATLQAGLAKEQRRAKPNESARAEEHQGDLEYLMPEAPQTSPKGLDGWQRADDSSTCRNNRDMDGSMEEYKLEEVSMVVPTGVNAPYINLSTDSCKLSVPVWSLRAMHMRRWQRERQEATLCNDMVKKVRREQALRQQCAILSKAIVHGSAASTHNCMSSQGGHVALPPRSCSVAALSSLLLANKRSSLPINQCRSSCSKEPAHGALERGHSKRASIDNSCLCPDAGTSHRVCPQPACGSARLARTCLEPPPSADAPGLPVPETSRDLSAVGVGLASSASTTETTNTPRSAPGWEPAGGELLKSMHALGVDVRPAEADAGSPSASRLRLLGSCKAALAAAGR